MDKIVHFEIPAEDLARAQKFYGETFGWQLQNMPEMNYVMAVTTETDENQMPKTPGAINGGLMKRDDRVQSPSLAVDVDDIDAAIEKVKQAGGTIIQGKTEIGDMGSMAYFKDTEGNVLSLWHSSR